MPYINLPPTVSELFWSLENRIRRLETAYRFNAPNIDFTTNTPTNPRVADIYYDTNADLLKYWNGYAWVEIADNNLGTSVLTYNTTIQTVNNNMAYTGNPCTIEIQKIGKMITANAIVDFANVTNFGTGQIYIDMPAQIPTRAHDLSAGGYLVDGVTTYSIFATLAATGNKMYLWHPTSNGGSGVMDYNSPAVLDTLSELNITGVALLA